MSLSDKTDADEEGLELEVNNKLPVQNDGRDLYQPESRWLSENRRLQKAEAIYIIGLLGVSLSLLACIGLLAASNAENSQVTIFGVVLPAVALKFGLLASGGLLGGTIYGAKWLYHAVAKGLWHEDRRLWRFMQPWISLGTTIGIWALIDSGFFPNAPPNVSMLGIGFVVGYLSDQFLAKMKEITNVLFGRAESHAERMKRDTNDRP